MERQPKSVLKKADSRNNNTPISNSRKVHFSPTHSTSSTMCESTNEARKRQTDSDETQMKKQRLCQVALELHETHELLTATVGQLGFINRKIDQAEFSHSENFAILADALCQMLEMENLIEELEMDLNNFEHHILRNDHEIDYQPIVDLQREATDADKLWMTLIGSLETSVEHVKADKIDLLNDDMVSIERVIKRMSLAT